MVCNGRCSHSENLCLFGKIRCEPIMVGCAHGPQSGNSDLSRRLCCWVCVCVCLGLPIARESLGSMTAIRPFVPAPRTMFPIGAPQTPELFAGRTPRRCLVQPAAPFGKSLWSGLLVSCTIEVGATCSRDPDVNLEIRDDESTRQLWEYTSVCPSGR